ncbi:AraC-like DNA-binding protein [Virgibacillus halotolerans]|uniref:helix-turn-helix transcriptional regulator n=1 Tax=Virgibacillus halotolerans TaxID=1071053 RepID=UPI0019611A0B|nr:AraC family transcriptional regulator [Virgibacillus halotolerans]MBM7599234.1 AraC-like DNA-binding protein [Virgibacillus halotolerans]
MKKYDRTDQEALHFNDEITTQGIIEETHKKREAFLYAIQTCNTAQLNKHRELFRFEHMKEDPLKIFNRVPGNRLRSYKNILLSHNTLYGYSAEKGGLSASQSHFMSEKYAIMIEHSSKSSQLDQIHENMIDAYTDPSLRIKKGKGVTLVERVENYVEMNFAEDDTIDEMAKRLHVHPSHLMRTFKKEKGMTISHFRNQKRLKEAKELLLHSNLTITELSMMVGFNNVPYFSKVFKEETGMTSKEYRKMHIRD